LKSNIPFLKIKDINASLLGKVVKVEGRIKNIRDRKTYLVRGVFKCKHCGTVISVGENSQYLVLPNECPNCHARGSKIFEFLSNESKLKDYLVATLEEGLGSIEVVFFDDLVVKLEKILDETRTVLVTGEVQTDYNFKVKKSGGNKFGYILLAKDVTKGIAKKRILYKEEKKFIVFSIIEKLEKELGSATIKDVLELSKEMNVKEEEAKQLINELLKEGKVSSPDGVSLKKVR